jgi:CRP-like cAMP-binding protein
VQIAAAGDEAERFFLIESGEVGVYHNGVQVGTLESGGYFGTMALLDSGEYLATYRALTPVHAFALPRSRFDPLLRADTTLSQQVSSGARHRRLLKKMPLFSSLSPQQLTAVDARLQHKPVAAGETIVRQGEPRSHLFIVADGVVEAIHEENGKERVVGRLGPGEHFGEYALFADTPYSATYRARRQGDLLLLDEAKFDDLVAGCERMSHYVEQIGSGRLFAARRRPGPSGVLA